MSHFYGVLKGSRGTATRCATAKSGLQTTAASWAGCITVGLYVDDKGRDCYIVTRGPWQGRGTFRLLARGRIR